MSNDVDDATLPPPPVRSPSPPSRVVSAQLRKIDKARGSVLLAKSHELIAQADYMTNALSVVVVGASGDLAKKKTFPALLDLFAHGHLPHHVNVVGVARSALTDEGLREKLRPFLDKMQDIDADLVEKFLACCTYRRMSSYADAEALAALHAELAAKEAAVSGGGGAGNRLFYFAIPPNVFLDTASTIKKTCEAPAPGFTRLVIEKPFGHDFNSATELAAAMGAIYPEEQLYRSELALEKEKGGKNYSQFFYQYSSLTDRYSPTTPSLCFCVLFMISSQSITTWARRWCRT